MWQEGIFFSEAFHVTYKCTLLYSLKKVYCQSKAKMQKGFFFSAIIHKYQYDIELLQGDNMHVSSLQNSSALNAYMMAVMLVTVICWDFVWREGLCLRLAVSASEYRKKDMRMLNTVNSKPGNTFEPTTFLPHPFPFGLPAANSEPVIVTENNWLIRRLAVSWVGCTGNCATWN